jgi:hypothetical protein
MYHLYPKFLVLSVRCLHHFASLALLKHDRFSVCIGFNSLTNEHSSALRSLNSMSCAINLVSLSAGSQAEGGSKLWEGKPAGLPWEAPRNPARTVGLPLHHICKHILRLVLSTFFLSSLQHVWYFVTAAWCVILCNCLNKHIYNFYIVNSVHYGGVNNSRNSNKCTIL